MDTIQSGTCLAGLAILKENSHDELAWPNSFGWLVACSGNQEWHADPAEALEHAIERAEQVAPHLMPLPSGFMIRQEALFNRLCPTDLFAGVPILTKDLFTPLRGARMTSGSLLSKDLVMPFDSEWSLACEMRGSRSSARRHHRNSEHPIRRNPGYLVPPETHGRLITPAGVQVAQRQHWWRPVFCPSHTQVTERDQSGFRHPHAVSSG